MLRTLAREFQTGAIAREFFNIARLRSSPHPGDAKLNGFLEARLRSLGDQEEPCAERQLERVFFDKIARRPEPRDDRSRAYLAGSADFPARNKDGQ